MKEAPVRHEEEALGRKKKGCTERLTPFCALGGSANAIQSAEDSKQSEYHVLNHVN
jgi:hypothetical protein